MQEHSAQRLRVPADTAEEWHVPVSIGTPLTIMLYCRSIIGQEAHQEVKAPLELHTQLVRQDHTSPQHVRHPPAQSLSLCFHSSSIAPV